MGKVNWWKVASVGGTFLTLIATGLGAVTQKHETKETIKKEVAKALNEKK